MLLAKGYQVHGIVRRASTFKTERLEAICNGHVERDPSYFWPTEVAFLRGDTPKARAKLAWKPRITFEELIRMMVEHDLDLARQEKTLVASGHKVNRRGDSLRQLA